MQVIEGLLDVSSMIHVCTVSMYVSRTRGTLYFEVGTQNL